MNNNKVFTPFSSYRITPKESKLASFISQLSLNPRLLAEFNNDPNATINLYAANLTGNEKKALLERNNGAIYMAVKNGG